MCTVSLLQDNNRILLTHNRDEQPSREAAEAPTWRTYHGAHLLYPKDGRAGGTWIAGNNQAIACLLNGAFEPHKHLPPYKKSRGLVLLDAVSNDEFENFIAEYDFMGIEPFTMLYVHLSKGNFLMRWDGQKIHATKNPKLPLLECSATLYSKTEMSNRKENFANLTNSSSTPDNSIILNFHLTQKFELSESNRMFKTETNIRTISITQFILENNELTFTYTDLL